MTSAARIRRLQAEYEDMCVLQESSSLLAFKAEGTPPTRYTIQLSCTGLCLLDNIVHGITNHQFDVLLGPEFPLLAPTIVWKTPVFHPNFRGPLVCMGDFWYPAWSLAEMCTAICEMVQYKTFNIYDPLDKQAASWLARELDENPTRFPVDNRPVRDLDFSISVAKERSSNGFKED